MELSLTEEAESLARVPLFKRLEHHELEKLAEEVDQVDYKAGDVIFNERDKGDALYVVETGAVRIWVMDEDVEPVTLAELKPGDFFGELADLDRGERSSSATALTDTHLHKLSSDAFQQFLIEHPDAAVDVICEIAQRMRQTNLLVSKRAARNINNWFCVPSFSPTATLRKRSNSSDRQSLLLWDGRRRSLLPIKTRTV